MGIVGAFIEDLIQSLHYEKLLCLSEVQKSVLSDELEDCSRVSDQEGVLWVFLEDEPKPLLGLRRGRRLLYLFFGRLLDLWFIKQHCILETIYLETIYLDLINRSSKTIRLRSLLYSSFNHSFFSKVS